MPRYHTALRGLGYRRFSAAVASVVGVALTGYGLSVHLSVVRAARCDGCSAWHPLFVVAPLVVGSVLLLGGVAYLAVGR